MRQTPEKKRVHDYDCQSKEQLQTCLNASVDSITGVELLYVAGKAEFDETGDPGQELLGELLDVNEDETLSSGSSFHAVG